MDYRSRLKPWVVTVGLIGAITGLLLLVVAVIAVGNAAWDWIESRPRDRPSIPKLSRDQIPFDESLLRARAAPRDRRRSAPADHPNPASRQR